MYVHLGKTTYCSTVYVSAPLVWCSYKNWYICCTMSMSSVTACLYLPDVKMRQMNVFLLHVYTMALVLTSLITSHATVRQALLDITVISTLMIVWLTPVKTMPHVLMVSIAAPVTVQLSFMVMTARMYEMPVIPAPAKTMEIVPLLATHTTVAVF